MRLEDKVAIVTGSAQGIGAAYAEGLAAEGANVVICDILNGTDVVNKIRTSGGDSISIATDVSDEAAVTNLVETTIDRYGRIDILVNNAALFVALYPMLDFTEIDVDRWNKVMAVNIRGTFLTCRAVVPIMRKQRYGRIINVSSSVFWRGLPGFLDYSTSKAAIIGLTRAMSHEVGSDGITVNSVAPGYTQSSGVIRVQDDGLGQDPWDVCAGQAIARPQVPEDLVGTIIFLASDDAAFITGQTIVNDGGLAHN